MLNRGIKIDSLNQINSTNLVKTFNQIIKNDSLKEKSLLIIVQAMEDTISVKDIKIANLNNEVYYIKTKTIPDEKKVSKRKGKLVGWILGLPVGVGMTLLYVAIKGLI